MSHELEGKKIAVLTANSGVEQVELSMPWQAIEDAGGVPTLVAPQAGTVQAFNHDVQKADEFSVDLTLEQAQVDDFDAVLLPGGTTNADSLRLVAEAVEFVTGAVEARKPVAAICHGPWSLVEAGVLPGKTLTSWPSLRTDIENAGGRWVDEEVFVCTAKGWLLLTSRKPEDLHAFCAALVDRF